MKNYIMIILLLPILFLIPVIAKDQSQPILPTQPVMPKQTEKVVQPVMPKSPESSAQVPQSSISGIQAPLPGSPLLVPSGKHIEQEIPVQQPVQTQQIARSRAPAPNVPVTTRPGAQLESSQLQIQSNQQSGEMPIQKP